MINQSINQSIDQVIDGTADIALASLTITPQRMDHVLFTRPFMPAGEFTKVGVG